MTTTDDTTPDMGSAPAPDLTQRVALLEQQLAALRADHDAAARPAWHDRDDDEEEDDDADWHGTVHRTDDRHARRGRGPRRGGRDARDRLAQTAMASGLPVWALIGLSVLALFGAMALLDGLHLFRHIDLF